MVNFVRLKQPETAARPLRAACILSILATVPVLAALFWAMPSRAADPQTAPGATQAASTLSASKSEVKPLWTELTPLQREVLSPMASQWPQLDANHKAKWLEVTRKYQAMPPEKQQKLKENIADWAKLTPEQHRQARENYARTKKLDPNQKAAQWQEYQQLPEDQKKKLAEDAPAKKRIANLPSLQAKAKTVEPLKAPKKPASAPAASAPLQAIPNTPAPNAGAIPVTNPQPAVPPTPAPPAGN